jgi:hypothetical protein
MLLYVINAALVNNRDKRPNSRIATLHCFIVTNPDSRKIERAVEIRIDAAKAERMIAQISPRRKRLLPAHANAVAANICRRLSSAMPFADQPALARLPDYFVTPARWWQ